MFRIDTSSLEIVEAVQLSNIGVIVIDEFSIRDSKYNLLVQYCNFNVFCENYL